MVAIKVEVFWLSMIHNLAWGRVSVEKWLVHHTVVANVVVDMAWDDMVSRHIGTFGYFSQTPKLEN